MKRRHQHDNDDRNRILKDGERLRVPLPLMDSMDPIQKAVARESLRVTDGQGGIAGLHRPGFRISATDALRDPPFSIKGEEDARRSRSVKRDPRGRIVSTAETEEEEEEDARDAAYRDHERYLNDAWKNPVGIGFGGGPSITGFGYRGNVGQREGDLCARDGYLRRGDDGQLYCQPDASDAKRRVPRCPEDYDEDNDDGENDEYESDDEEMVRNASTHTEPSIRRDHRSIKQMMADHAAMMEQLYNQLDCELCEAYRKG